MFVQLAFKKRLLRLRPSLVIASIFSLAVTLMIFVLWYTSDQVQQTFVAQVKLRQLVSARVVARGFDNFFNDRKPDIARLAELESIYNIEKEQGRELLAEAAQHLTEKDHLITSLVRLDSEGYVVWDAASERVSFEKSVFLGDRPYFLWARDESSSKEILVTSPFVAGSKGMRSLMVTPLFEQGEFDGLLFASIDINEMTRDYLVDFIPLGLGMEGMVVSRDGFIVGGTMDRSLVGEKLSNYNCMLEEKRAENLEKFRKNFLSGREGSLVHECLLFRDENGEPGEMLTSFSPTASPGVDWVVLISTPLENIGNHLRPSQTVVVVGVGVSAVMIIFGIGLSITWYRLSSRKARRFGLQHVKDKAK
ncbi:cache domain-containing protein [Patescibacteria group bacterium]|nr:cache domain-containing protein [Patescibacteria group bacterium]